MAYMKDHSGDGRGRRSKVRSHHKGDVGGVRSFRCLDCGKLNYILHKDVRRRGRIACKSCQGALEETSVSKKREDLSSKPVVALKRARCKACGCCVEGLGLQFHLEGNPECRYYYDSTGIEPSGQEPRSWEELKQSAKKKRDQRKSEKELSQPVCACEFCEQMFFNVFERAEHILEKHKDEYARRCSEIDRRRKTHTPKSEREAARAAELLERKRRVDQKIFDRSE